MSAACVPMPERIILQRVTVEQRIKLGLPDAKPSPDDASDNHKPPDTRQKSEFDYFSTHPATADRIRAAEAATSEGAR